MNDVVILSAVRTPIGSFLGSLAPVPAPRLGGAAVAAALERAGVAAEAISQVIMGEVLTAGVGQAPARQAALEAGLPNHVGAITVGKVCGSGLRAVMDARNGLLCGEWTFVVAGGMESMSNVPHLLENSRRGYRLGEVVLYDSMVKDGLWDPYSQQHMGSCAELCAKKYNYSRQQQDDYARASYERARSAVQSGQMDAECVTVAVPQRRGEPILFKRDEEPFAAPLEKMSALRPAFEADGTITAGNASTLNDGAAALVLCTGEVAQAFGHKPIARIVAQTSVASAPQWFTTAPIKAIEQVLRLAKLEARDINHWEINEAFAVVAMAAIDDLQLDPKRVNPRGGAIALGHPIGASGARILTTLIHALEQNQARYGCAAICIGGGEAIAMVIENLSGAK